MMCMPFFVSLQFKEPPSVKKRKETPLHLSHTNINKSELMYLKSLSHCQLLQAPWTSEGR